MVPTPNLLFAKCLTTHRSEILTSCLPTSQIRYKSPVALSRSSNLNSNTAVARTLLMMMVQSLFPHKYLLGETLQRLWTPFLSATVVSDHFFFVIIAPPIIRIFVCSLLSPAWLQPLSQPQTPPLPDPPFLSPATRKPPVWLSQLLKGASLYCKLVPDLIIATVE